MNPRILLLALAVFAFGSAAFVFAGLLEPMAADLGVSTAVAGQLQTAYVLAAALLGPPAAFALGRLDRRLVVIGGLGFALAAHVLCALSPNFAGLLALRGVAGLAGAIAAPAASTAAAALAPPHRRGAALATVTGGLMLAFMLGIPLGSLVGAAFGWRATFLFAAGVSAAALAAVALWLPRVPPAASTGRSLALAETWPLFLTTLLAFAPTMTLNVYIAPIVRVGAGVTGAGVGLFQATIGLGALAGLRLGGRAADRQAGRRWILGAILTQAGAVVLVLAATSGLTPAGWPGAAAVGVATFSAAAALFAIMPVIQARLIAATGGAPVALAVNSSLMSLGQAIGAGLGGATLAVWGVPAIAGAALVLSLGALAALAAVFPRRVPSTEKGGQVAPAALTISPR